MTHHPSPITSDYISRTSLLPLEGELEGVSSLPAPRSSKIVPRSSKIVPITHHLTPITLLCLICMSASTAHAQSSSNIDRNRQTKVYYGMMGKFNETCETSNRSKWSYSRENLTGFYTNFIDAWQQKYQSGRTLAAMASLLAETFPGKRLFYEGSMENQVNDSPNGRTDNTFETEVFTTYQNAGFTIDFGAINYMSNSPTGTGGINDTHNSISECKAKIAHYREDGVDQVLYLCGPWTSGAELYTNNDARTMASWTDGVLSDGPLGYWVADNGNYRRNSRNIVRYCREHNMTSALMICPYSVDGAGGYSPYNGGFLDAAKQHVFDQEDNNCMPDVWALWNYGGTEVSNFPQFPESQLTDGALQPQNTCTGVAYWLLYHLREFPTVSLNTQHPSPITQHGNANFSANVQKGNTLTLQLTLQSENKWIELSPVLNSIITKNAADWNITFKLNGTDVTTNMTQLGGYNCVGDYRISDGSPLTLTISATPLTDNASTELRIEAMSNIGNTVNSKIISRIVLNDEYTDDGTEDGSYTGTPWNGSPIKIPGRLQCEEFDKGDKGMAWDWNDGPFAGQGREPNDGIQFIANGSRLGWLTDNDENWAVYTIQVDRESDYQFTSSTATIRIEIDGYTSQKATVIDDVHLRAGVHQLKIWYYSGTGDADYIDIADTGTQIPDDYTGTPWNGTPTVLPGKLQCEEFDRGDRGMVWDWNAGPFAGQGRESGDGIEFIFGGIRLGWLSANDENWAVYTVNVAEEADYIVKSETAIIRLETDDFVTERATEFEKIHLKKGTCLLKVWYYEGNGDADYIEFLTTEYDPVAQYQGTPYTGTPAAIPGKIECENFDLGGEGVAFYWQANKSNPSPGYRPDAAFIGNGGTGHNTGWNDGADWAIYTVNVAEEGVYNANANVASPNANAALQFEVDFVRYETVYNFGKTGDDFGIYQLKTMPGIFLPQGQHLLKVYYTSTDADYIDFQLSSTPTAITQHPSPNTHHPSPLYNLQGQRLSRPARGINIVNGTKVVVK